MLNHLNNSLKSTDSESTQMRLMSQLEILTNPEAAQNQMMQLMAFHKQIKVDLPQVLASSTELETKLPMAVVANVIRKKVLQIEQNTIKS